MIKLIAIEMMLFQGSNIDVMMVRRLATIVHIQAQLFNPQSPQKRMTPIIPRINGIAANKIKSGASNRAAMTASPPTTNRARAPSNCRIANIVTPSGLSAIFR